MMLQSTSKNSYSSLISPDHCDQIIKDRWCVPSLSLLDKVIEVLEGCPHTVEYAANACQDFIRMLISLNQILKLTFLKLHVCVRIIFTYPSRF